jgi:hypothetical protein
MSGYEKMQEMLARQPPLPAILTQRGADGLPMWMSQQAKDDWKAKVDQMEADTKSGKLRDPVLSDVPHALMTRKQLLAEMKSLEEQRFYGAGMMAAASWQFHNSDNCGKEIDDEQERLYYLDEAQKEAGINPYHSSSAPPKK